MSEYDLKSGQILVYRSSNLIKLAVFMSKKGDKLSILSEDNNRLNINESKVEYILDKCLPLDEKDFIISKQLKKTKSDAKKNHPNTDVSELYELVSEENQGFSSKELSEFIFDSNIEEEQFLSFLLELYSDTIYFKLKNNVFYPKSEKQVSDYFEAERKKRENEYKKEQSKNSAIEWIKNVLEKEQEDTHNLDIPSEVISLLNPIKQYIIFQDEYEKKGHALELINELKQKTPFQVVGNVIESAFRLFIRLGIFTENENLSLHKYNITTDFSDKALKESNNVIPFSIDSLRVSRIDFTEPYTITIDDENTKDIDDAVSLEKLDNNAFRIGIHITDVSHFIKSETALDKEALDRGMTVYLPVGKISMFPERLSEDLMSLLENEVRPTLSFLITFDSNYHIIEKDIKISTIKVDKKLSYDMADNILDDKEHQLNPMLKKLFEFTSSLNQKRIDNGAIDFSNFEIKVKLDDDGNILLKKVISNNKSDFIIKELMIFANSIAAEYCWINQIPAIYFSQELPDENIRFTDDVIRKRSQFFDNIRKLKKTDIDSYPKNHSSLGVDAYTQSTSPIRRYHDIIIHRQLKEFLISKKLFYNKEEVQRVAATAEQTSRETRTVEKETKRYWILKYLTSYKGRSVSATVIKKLTNSYIVELNDTLVQAQLITHKNLSFDEVVDVTIERVNPLLNTISLKRIP